MCIHIKQDGNQAYSACICLGHTKLSWNSMEINLGHITYIYTYWSIRWFNANSDIFWFRWKPYIDDCNEYMLLLKYNTCSRTTNCKKMRWNILQKDVITLSRRSNIYVWVRPILNKTVKHGLLHPCWSWNMKLMLIFVFKSTSKVAY